MSLLWDLEKGKAGKHTFMLETEMRVRYRHAVPGIILQPEISPLFFHFLSTALCFRLQYSSLSRAGQVEQLRTSWWPAPRYHV